jgi:Ser-tRNA(Ala) deacylase AlaX
MNKNDAASIVDLSKPPDEASETLRIVRVGDYDACACIGTHVSNTSEIGHVKLLNYDYTEGRLRLRFKLV